MAFARFMAFCMLTFVFYLELVDIVHCEQCLQSLPTRSKVTACPKDATEWKEAKERKRCEYVIQNCTELENFEYHCLSDTLQSMFVEICAPIKLIVGQYCPSYDMKNNSIRQNFNQPCKDHLNKCPAVYKSSAAYLYQDCYNEKTSRETNSNNNTSPITIDIMFFKIGFFVICGFLCLLVALLAIHLWGHEKQGECYKKYCCKKNEEPTGQNEKKEEELPLGPSKS